MKWKEQAKINSPVHVKFEQQEVVSIRVQSAMM